MAHWENSFYIRGTFYIDYIQYLIYSYIFEGDSIIIRTLSVEFIVINLKKKNIISLHDLFFSNTLWPPVCWQVVKV